MYRNHSRNVISKITSNKESATYYYCYFFFSFQLFNFSTSPSFFLFFVSSAASTMVVLQYSHFSLFYFPSSFCRCLCSQHIRDAFLKFSPFFFIFLMHPFMGISSSSFLQPHLTLGLSTMQYRSQRCNNTFTFFFFLPFIFNFTFVVFFFFCDFYLIDIAFCFFYFFVHLKKIFPPPLRCTPNIAIHIQNQQKKKKNLSKPKRNGRLCPR